MAGVTYVWLGPEWLTIGEKYCPQGVLEPGFDVPEGALPVKALEEYVEMGKARKVVEPVKIVHPPKVVTPPDTDADTDTDTDTDTDAEPEPKAKKKAKKKASKRRKRSK